MPYDSIKMQLESDWIREACWLASHKVYKAIVQFDSQQLGNPGWDKWTRGTKTNQIDEDVVVLMSQVLEEL